MNQRGLAAALAGDARRCRADPRLRRAGPRRDLRRRGPLRPRRVRGPAADGRGRRASSRGEPGADAAARCAQRRVRRRGPGRPRPRRGHAGALRRRRSTTRCPTPPFWGDRVVKGIALADYAALPRRAGALPRPVGPASRRAARAAPSYEELVETEGRPRLRLLARPRPDREPARGRPSSTATSRAGARATTSSCSTTTAVTERAPLHLPAAAPRPAPVPRRLLPAARVRRDRRRRVPARHRWARGSREATAELFADERLPRLPRAARPVGAAHRGAGRVLARAGPRRARLRRRGLDPTCTSVLPRRATAGRATPSATRPAPTSRTARRSSSCSSPSGSASSCPRSSSCTPSSRPTRSSCTTPRRSTSTPGDALCHRSSRAVRHGRHRSSTPSRYWMAAEHALVAEFGGTWTDADGASLVGNPLHHVRPDHPRAGERRRCPTR